MDYLVAAEDAKLSARFIKMGVVPELASSKFLVARMGFGHASELMLTGKTINGTEAAEFRVFDATGRSIHTFFLGAGNQAQLPSEGWAAGTYTIRSLTPSGQASTVRLLVD